MGAVARELPHSLEAEQALLGALMLDDAKVSAVRDVVTVGDFYRREHRLIFEAMLKQAEARKPIDLITLSEALSDSNQLQEAGGLDYLGALVTNIHSAANVVAYAGIIKERATDRQIVRASQELSEIAMTGGTLSDKLTAAKSLFTSLERGEIRKLPPAFTVADVGDVMSAQIEPPQFVVSQILPRRHVTLLGGHGGAGKTLLALTIAAHVAAGVPFAGFFTTQASVAIASLEDEPAVMRLRLRKIIEHYRLDAHEVLQRITLLDGTQGNTALIVEALSHNAPAILTPAFDELRAHAQGASLLIVDNASDAFDANENSRRSVRAFVRALASIARENDAAVVLLAHIDKTAARHGANGNSYSGSTAWHNSARSRLALLIQEDGSLLLEHEKCNIGKRADPVRLVMNEKGLPVPELALAPAGGDSWERAGIIQAFRAAEAAGVTVPANLTPGAHSAMSALQSFPEYPARLVNDRRGRVQATQIITQLKREGLLVEQEYTKANRHKSTRLKLAQGKKCVDPSEPASANGTYPATVTAPESALRHPLIPPRASTHGTGACVNAPNINKDDRRTIDASTHSAEQIPE